MERKIVLCFLCSLLNTALGGSTGSGGKEEKVGGGGGVAVGGEQQSSIFSLATSTADKLSGVVLRREDVRGLLGHSCLQVLSALLVQHAPAPDFNVELPPSSSSSSSSTTTTTPGPSPFVEQGPTNNSPPSNAFTFYLAKLHRPADFEFLLSGFLNLLERGLGGGGGTPLTNFGFGVGGGGGGGGGAATNGTTEILVVLWKVLDGNQKFRNWLNEQEKVGELVGWLVVAGLEGKDDESEFLCSTYLRLFFKS